VIVNEFIWPQDRIEHIGKHGVEPHEMEEVCFGQALVQRAKASGANPVDYELGKPYPDVICFASSYSFLTAKVFP
jgi:hypothetical protein